MLPKNKKMYQKWKITLFRSEDLQVLKTVDKTDFCVEKAILSVEKYTTKIILFRYLTYFNA